MSKLDPVLRYPTQLTERIDLTLVQAIDSEKTVKQRLIFAFNAAPKRCATKETEILAKVQADQAQTLPPRLR